MNPRDMPGVAIAPAGTANLIETIGLPQAITSLVKWAQPLGLLPILIAVIDATKTGRHPKAVGTIVQFIKQPEVAIHLGIWANELPCAGELKRLSDAFSLSDFISTEYPAMPSLKLVSQQLTGGLLTGLPAVALVVRPIPPMADSDHRWLTAFRTWVFVQTIDATYRGSRPNRYLEDVTNKLRLAIDRKEDWRELFASLRGSFASFYGITRHLAATSKRLLADKATASAHMPLLRSLGSFCDGKTPVTGANAEDENHGQFQRFLELAGPENAIPLRRDELVILDRTTSTSEQAECAEVWNFDSADAEESAIGVTSVDEKRTPPEQDHQARGILLATAEDHQFLAFSWNRPAPAELVELDRWLTTALRGEDLELQTLATFTAIAAQTANSLHTVLSIPLTTSPGPDWSLDINKGCLQRLPPRRYNGWHVTQEATAWVEPLTESLSLHLAPAALSLMRRLHANAPGSSQLGHLWPAAAGMSPATYFSSVCQKTKGLERLRSGMLAQILEQQVFAETGDSVLSQLLASHPRTGLGGACAYASYQYQLVQPLLTRRSALLSAPSLDEDSSPHANAAGSELFPLDEALRRSCSEALEEIHRLSAHASLWTAHHNALTAYIVVVLLAATGARPVTSPFESLGSFDWSSSSLYIVDKVSSPLHQGRLVPLPPRVMSLIKECYLPHLARLAALVSKIDPPLSEELARISRGQASDRLPLFFLLRANPTLRWFEVSESSLGALGIFSWPLPWNLMRHRLPTVLKRAGHDHECVNGITGHGDNGTAPYGPYSMRVWQDDADKLRQPLAEALSCLGFDMPVAPPWEPEPLDWIDPPAAASCLGKEAKFGEALREVRRKASHLQAREQAIDDIHQYVAGRPIDSLTPGEWETLSQKMLLHDDRRPRTLGTIRYEALQQWISQHWQNRGSRPRIKRRYLPALEEKSPFTAAVIGCQQRISAALGIARAAVMTRASSRRSQRESLALGITLLILESCLADPAVIKDLLQNKNYRLIKFLGRYSLEHSPGLDKVSRAPVRRYALSSDTAQLFLRAKSSGINLSLERFSSNETLEQIGQVFSLDSRCAFQPLALSIAGRMREANMMAFPGLVAAYLNGEIISTGLAHPDLVRVVTGRAVNFKQVESSPSAEADSNSYNEDDEDAPPSKEMDGFIPWPDAFMSPKPSIHPASADISELQQNCFRFFQQIRDVFKQKPDGKITARRDLDAKLRAVISAHKSQVSRSCLLLGEWQRSLLWRKTKNGLIRIASLERYFNALSVCFQAMAYQHDLLGGDEDDVTEFYLRVMETRQLVRPGLSPSIIPLAAQAAGGEPDRDGHEKSEAIRYRSQNLALQLLKDFHRLVSREFGVEDPDWSEIGVTDELLSISPGMLTEAEYFCALRQLACEPATASREELARAFILLLAYRFGLRGAEATSLSRADWVDDQPEAVVVLVRSNRWRRLKTVAGQRQVPQLFLFSDHEKEIVASWLNSWLGITSFDGDGPLFADLQSPEHLMNGPSLRREVTAVIKQVTHNPDLSTHHARHAFGNHVSLLLFDQAAGLWPHALASGQTTEQRKHHVRRLLLGTEQVTRRSLWAIARLLGHAHPRTFIRSYLHLLPELAAHYVNLAADVKRALPLDLREALIDLDQLPESEGYLNLVPPKPAPAPVRCLTAERALRFLHLCHRGVESGRAQAIIGMSEDEATNLIQAVTNLDAVLARRPHINRIGAGNSILLSHIPEARWAALIVRAHAVAWATDLQGGSDIGADKLPEMVGASRQLVLWKPAHFSFFHQMVQAWKLCDASFSFACTTRGKEALLEMGANAGWAQHLELKLRSELAVTASPQQIDPIEFGIPPTLAKNRCAVLTKTAATSDLRSSYEIVLLCLVSVLLHERAYQRFMPA